MASDTAPPPGTPSDWPGRFEQLHRDVRELTRTVDQLVTAVQGITRNEVKVDGLEARLRKVENAQASSMSASSVKWGIAAAVAAAVLSFVFSALKDQTAAVQVHAPAPYYSQPRDEGRRYRRPSGERVERGKSTGD